MGTWKLNAEMSKFTPGPAPKSLTTRFEPSGKSVKWTAERVGADGKASFVGTPGTALGLLPQVKSPNMSVSLAPGDTLIFYTDGVTERRRGTELFGIERLRAAAGTFAGLSAAAVATRLRATALAFSPEPPRDDIAILALRNEA